MSSKEPGYAAPSAWSSRHGAARDLTRAVAERERGRHRLNTATVTVGFASVVTAGVVAVALPGSTHKTVTSSNSSSSGSAGSSGSGSSNSSNSPNSSGSLQAPWNVPVRSGGGQSTSGGT